MSSHSLSDLEKTNLEIVPLHEYIRTKCIIVDDARALGSLIFCNPSSQKIKIKLK